MSEAETYYVVRCAEYTSPPYRSRDRAERKKAEIEKLRRCPHNHTIKEISIKSLKSDR